MEYKVKCKVTNVETDESVSATAENDNSKIVARNSAIMKVTNNDDLDWEDESFEIECHL